MSLDFAVRQVEVIEPLFDLQPGVATDTDTDDESGFPIPIVCVVQSDTRMSRGVLAAFIIALVTPILIVGSVTVSAVASDVAGAESSARP